MKKLLLAFIVCLSLGVSADDHSKSGHMDVIEFEMLEGCSMEKYMEIVKDFNVWGKRHGYHAKIAAPLQSNNLTSYYWLGTSKDVATFGKAYDAWRNAQSDSDSEPAKLAARFSECTKNLGRRGYTLH